MRKSWADGEGEGGGVDGGVIAGEWVMLGGGDADRVEASVGRGDGCSDGIDEKESNKEGEAVDDVVAVGVVVGNGVSLGEGVRVKDVVTVEDGEEVWVRVEEGVRVRDAEIEAVGD